MAKARFSLSQQEHPKDGRRRSTVVRFSAVHENLIGLKSPPKLMKGSLVSKESYKTPPRSLNTTAESPEKRRSPYSGSSSAMKLVY